MKAAFFRNNDTPESTIKKIERELQQEADRIFLQLRPETEQALINAGLQPSEVDKALKELKESTYRQAEKLYFEHLNKAIENHKEKEAEGVASTSTNSARK